ncbi:MAG: catechol 2,3-dioxygenase-like lactoylglutathione lyase family enzyme [Pseudohongiellaceae bacterium]|jgi:catechol 2,3-dioxygenase-like lactoylglutathione lyase family enzyme
MQRSAQVSMLVCDYDEDLAFYIDKLGFDLVEDPALDDRGKRWVAIKPNGSSGLYLLVEKASGEAQSKQIGHQTGGGFSFFFRPMT